MRLKRSTVQKMIVAACAASFVSIASATTYTDTSSVTTTTTDVAGGAGAAADIANVVVTNDAFDLHVTINMNPTANLTSNFYAAYEMGIQVGNGAGGQTLINNNYNLADPTGGNPFGNTVGISTGENFFIGSNLPGSPNSATGDAVLYGFTAGAGWASLYNTDTDPTRFSANATSLSFYFPLANLGLSAGNTIKFDVWSTFTSGNPPGQGAYDALDAAATPVGVTQASYGTASPVTESMPWMGDIYDAATAPGSTLSVYTIVGATVAGVWNVDGGGSWNATGSWTAAGVPNGPASTATFGSILDAGHAPAIVTVDSSQTVGQITFSNANTYSITNTGGSSLTINDTGDSGGVNPLISATLGNHTIALPIFLSGGVTLNAAASSSLSISGDVSTAGISGTGPVTIAGAGSVTLSGTNSYTGNTIVNSGATLNVGSATLAGALPASTTLLANGTTNFTANPGTGILARTLAGITLSSPGKVVVANPVGNVHANRTVLTTGALTFGGTLNSWQGLVNLNGNDMIVQGGGATSLTNVTNQLKLGFNAAAHGYWNGTAGIISSTAAGDTRHLTTLGSRLSGGTAFDGVNTTTNDVLVKYTYYGDADLSGTVDGADYTQIDHGFGMHLTGWQNGDFNYDGVVDGSDYTLIDNTFNQIKATGATPLALLATPATGLSAVPEPGSICLIGIGALAAMSRRRRSTRS